MRTPDRSAPSQLGPARSDVGWIRPAGWSPGAGTLVGAWIAGAAIARLTGATAVILLLAAALVSLLLEIVAGWWTTRSVTIRSVVAPQVVTVGEHCRLLVTVDAGDRAGDRAGSIGQHRITIRHADGTSLTVDGASGHDAMDDDAGADGARRVTVSFGTPGVVSSLVVRVDVAGPAGLIWWRRTWSVAVDPLHVAPAGHGPLLDTESAATDSDGPVEARRGNHDGEIDGVRPWRHGDSTNSVHWASSLRTNELIVHDRLTATDRRWVVDLDTAVVDAARLRWTLDEGRHHGHDVSVRTGDGTLHAVTDADDAATWSAIAAQAQTDARDDTADGNRPTPPGLLHRDLRLRPETLETDTAITSTARWTAAAAAFASMGMLVGALGGSATTLVLVLVSVAVGAIVSSWVARRSGRRPVLMQAAIVAAVLVALAAIAMQAADVGGLLAALRGPLPNVLMLLVVLHGFEAIDRRTLRVHLAITLVLASYAAGLRIDAMLGWWLAAWAIPFTVSLFAIARPRRPASGRERARPRPAAGSVRGTARGVVSVVAVGAATLAVLSLVPIPDGPARLGLPALSVDAPSVATPGGLARPDGSTAAPGGADDGAPDRNGIGDVVGYPGFTETLDTSVRGELGDQIVMRVRAPEPAFWRGQTFTEFDGRTWTVSPDLGSPRDGPVIDVPPTIGDALGAGVPSRELVQTYFVEQDLPNVVFAAARPVQVIFDGTLWTRPDSALRSDVTLTSGSVYTVISERLQVNADLLRAQGDLGELFAGYRDIAGGAELDPFLAIPESTTQRTIDLANELRTPGESTYDTILAYEAWLGANTEYDLDAPVPADGADAVDDFLFESRRGYCEQIASTLTIMLRSQGVPARLATGYVPGERDRVSGVWNVRGNDAHAWVEVWFPQTGWQAFDPTAEVPFAADAGNGTVGGDLIGATVSSISSHRIEVGMALLATGVAWALLQLAGRARHRRRRGRWGLLQDRFSGLPGLDPAGDGDGGGGSGRAEPVWTNARIAASVADEPAARLVADELDRVAFDPSWVDDDERFERTRSALATLERSRR